MIRSSNDNTTTADTLAPFSPAPATMAAANVAVHSSDLVGQPLGAPSEGLEAPVDASLIHETWYLPN